jgi:hypothetical protein
MGMIGNLRPATDAEIDGLLANPSEITRFLYSASVDASDHLPLNRTWHAIHYALTGSRLGGEAPLNFLVDLGTPVGDVDVGYGPARVFTSQQVQHLAEALKAIEPEDIARRIDAQTLDQQAIYPGNWQRDGQCVEDVVASYRSMRDMIQRLASEGRGLVLYIN